MSQWLVDVSAMGYAFEEALVESKTGRQTHSNVTYLPGGGAIGIAQARYRILVATGPVDYRT